LAPIIDSLPFRPARSLQATARVADGSAQPPRLWGERVYSRLFYWNEAAHGGHFAAFEQPALFVNELRAAFRALPGGR
jgi:hypothetical protein